MEYNSELIECVIDGNSGIYCPQRFAMEYGNEVLSENTEEMKECINICEHGPDIADPELYWDAWEYILDNGTMEIDGIKYAIFQDQDVFIYPYDMDLEPFFE